MAYTITDACVGCATCAKHCPVGAISGRPKARHTVNAKRCVACGVCGRVCPHGAVKTPAGRKAARQPRARWPRPVVDAPACSACGLCVADCRFSCLAITPPRQKGDIQVYAFLADAAACVGCGLCAAVCPLGAIRMEEKEAPTP